MSFAAHSGRDSEEGLITLCISYHEENHSQLREARSWVAMREIYAAAFRNLTFLTTLNTALYFSTDC